jgi:hypothetical protein
MRNYPLRFWTRTRYGHWQEIRKEEIAEVNADGGDIYWVYNSMVSPFGDRDIDKLVEINALYVEVDGNKERVRSRIRKHLPPSTIIETKNGYHLYWDLKEPLKDKDGSWFRNFVKERLLVPFEGDPNAVDAVRLLRVPECRYWKNGADGSFVIKALRSLAVTYDLKDLEKAFPITNPQKSRVTIPRGTMSQQIEDKLPADQWLRLLSGHPSVRGEHFTLHSKGMVDQIHANGKETPCWVDMDGRIGSSSGGGPTILQWLMWYGNTMEESRAILNALYASR